MTRRTVTFLILNFGALGIGGIFTGKGVPSSWYAELAKAPWTPPGWAFGFAWTVIMICFSVYMAYLWPGHKKIKNIVGIYTIQWILNVTWNPIFFYLHHVGFALAVIVTLTIFIGYMFYHYWPLLKAKSALLLPYLVWLLVATSLNGFIYFEN